MIDDDLRVSVENVPHRGCCVSRRKASATIVDVARVSGVSTSTVSKVIRDAYGVSAETRDRVLEVIQQLGYRPSVGARSMRGSTYTLGFVVQGSFSPFFSDIYDGFVEELDGTRFRAIVALSTDPSGDGSQAIQDLLDRQVDGLVLVAPGVSRSWLEDVSQRRPVVVVGRHDESDAYDSVVGNDELGAAMVMQHLFELGHRNIAHIANRPGTEPLLDTPHADWVRRSAYERAMTDAGFGDLIIVVESQFEEQAAYRSTAELLERHPEVTAIFAGADEAAFGVLRALGDLASVVEEMIAVVGYDNTRFADHPRMSLTSVDQSGHELGRRAASLVLDRITHDRSAVHEAFQPRLVVRRTSVVGPHIQALGNDREGQIL